MAGRSDGAIILEPVASSASADLNPRRRPVRFRPRVLLVEPDGELRTALASALVGAGLEVLAAPAIEPVLGELEGEPARLPHLLLTSVEPHEGGMDGLALCERLRSQPQTEHLPVLLVSRRDNPAQRLRAVRVRADDYLSQPQVQDLVVLARLKAGRRSTEGGLEAHTARLPLCEVVRALLTGVRAGRVELRDNEGWLSFRDGHLVDASYGSDRGLVGARRFLLFGSGAYAVTLSEQLAQGDRLIDHATYCAMLLPAAERFAVLCGLGVPLSARLTVDFKRLADVLRSLPDEVGRVIRLFDGQRTVNTALLECSLSEVVTLEAVTLLYALGVLVPTRVISEREPPAEHVPPFFEPELKEEPFAEAFASTAH
jgi:CheY-like chemotaxis protein